MTFRWLARFATVALALFALGHAPGAAAQGGFSGSANNTIVFAPNAGGASSCLTRLASNLVPPPLFAFINYTPPSPPTLNALATLSATYSFPVGNYGGGSPRFALDIDQDNNGSVDGTVQVYIGTVPNFNDAGHTGFVSTGNFIGGTDTRWDLTQFGGGFYSTYAQATTLLGTGTVRAVSLIVDGGFTGDQAALIEAFTVDSATFVTQCPGTPVPSLHEESVVLLVALLASLAWVVRRRRPARSTRR